MQTTRSNPDFLKVLHIRPAPGDERTASDFDALLATTHLHVETCEDVYRGLARLCRPDLDPLGAVFVRVDVLQPAEFEFFTLASRVRQSVPVYVYSQRPSETSIAEAIQLGATGEANSETIHSLASGGPGLPPAFAPPGDLLGVEFDEAAQHPTDDPVEATPPEQQELRPADGEIGESAEPAPMPSRARVPWLHYADRPKRAGPPLREPPDSGRNAPEDQTSRPVSHEPLLTEAELQALLGDDIAAIAPAEDDDQGAKDEARREDGP